MQPLMMLSIALFIASALLAITAVTLFFRLNVREAYDELTGKTATREIALMREQGISRQGRGRSLQSIMGADTESSGTFDIERLGLSFAAEDFIEDGYQVAISGQPTDSEPCTEFLGAAAAATIEPQTQYLGAASVVVPELATEYLGDASAEPVQEPATEYLGAPLEPAIDPPTEFLDPAVGDCTG